MFDSLRRWLSSKEVKQRRAPRGRRKPGPRRGTTSADKRYRRRLDVVEHSLENMEERLLTLNEYTSTLSQEIAGLKESLDRMEASINKELRAGVRESKKISSLVREIESKRDQINKLQGKVIRPIQEGSRRTESRAPASSSSYTNKGKKDHQEHHPPSGDDVEWDEAPPKKVRSDKGLPRDTVRSVTTSFLLNGGKVLVLRRSDRVSTYPGRWAGISGTIERDETPTETALREISEETGLGQEQLTLIREGEPLQVKDDGRFWTVHPFLFLSETRKVTLNWEHTDSRWVLPNELSTLDTVPDLKKGLDRVID